MAGVEETVKESLDVVKSLTPSDKTKLTAALVTDIKELRKPIGLRMRAERAELAQFRPLPLTLITAVSGGIAEPVRRNLIGRLVTPCAQQGLALIVAGGLVQFAARIKSIRIPLLGPFGAAHCAYGGALVAISLYGSKDNPDPVKIALEGTTYKSMHPDKDKEK